ncbi:MAG: hypothetical protein FJZ38_00840 [Candidatus Rokubacteria bacterium]|nr:hypothetical protein [Candidatus Rokubacteria bacterium]
MIRHRLVRAALFSIIAVALVGRVAAQPATTDDAERERRFVEALRRDDPAAADRYLSLRDARAHALAELRRVEEQYNRAGPELRGLFVRSLVQARKHYAETSLALLDFHDARDRDLIARYQEEIGKINAVLDARRTSREELEKLRAP